jgi:subtilisin family serine protease
VHVVSVFIRQFVSRLPISLHRKSLSEPASLRRKITCVAPLLALAIHLQAQINTNTIVPNRYILVYHNATIPGDAETHAHLAGARILHRNERFGIAAVQTVTPSLNQTAAQTDAANMRRLAAQPNVDYVLHDRIVAAHQLLVEPVLNPAFSIVVGLHSPIHVHPTGPEPTGNPKPHGPVLSPTPDPDPSPTQTPQPAQPPYDTYYNSPQGWAVRQVGGYGKNTPGGLAQGPWDTTTGKGVRIAILDSGIDATHPDIAPNLALNLSEINQDPQTGLPSACDDGSPQDQEGHGTWTASLAAAAMGPGTGQLIGVAPSATLLNIKVLQRMPIVSANPDVAANCTAGQASGLLSWVIQGIEDAMANHADVVSMSLGTIVDLSTGDGAGLQAAFDRVTYAASQAGVVLVAAAGNDGFNLSNPRYIEIPAQARGVLAIVASTNPACAENNNPSATCAPGPSTLAYYSNYGVPLNALAAPGGSYPVGPDTAISGWIRGACSSGLPSTTDGPPSDSSHSFGCFNLGHTAYVQAMGTSASAPLVAGVAALLRAAHPSWDAPTIITALRSSAVSTPTLPVPQVSAAAVLTLVTQSVAQ